MANQPEYRQSSDFREFLYSIQRGQVIGYTYMTFHGFCTEASTTFFNTIWSAHAPSKYNFLAAAQVLQLSSTNANDTAAGTGARTVLIIGLDANYDQISEVVTLNGTTAVNTVNSYLRINRMDCQTYGTDRRNRGDIYLGSGVVTAGSNSIPHGYIIRGSEISEVGVFTVPRGFSLLTFDLNSSVTAGKEISYRTLFRPSASDPFQFKTWTNIFEKNIGAFEITTSTFSEMTDIDAQCIAISPNASVGLDVQAALVDNKYM